jgi:hypothetical protein
LLNTWYTTKLSKFIAKLKSVDEGNGTLLNYSIVMFGSSMKEGNLHLPKDRPLVLFGKGGRLICFSRI